MKTIVIAGGGRHVGKTTLATAIGALLENSRVVKLGTHPASMDKPSLYFQRGTSFKAIKDAVQDCSYLVIESGTILDDADLRPDLVVFLPAPPGRENKPGSEHRRRRADIVRGEAVSMDYVESITGKLDIDLDTVEKILRAVNMPFAP
ncbi:MAG: hypothetical protein GY854_32250 [Deltaproteobacteria bacterium]|nr:hypothetical protein [Deltaproteobacteria bacterium]